ncbi:hypothetical protein ACQUJO_01290 [Ralstonia pseudosolanacearum]
MTLSKRGSAGLRRLSEHQGFEVQLSALGGVLVIYLLVTILPQIFSFMENHANWNALSSTQLARHHSIEVIFRAIVFLTIAVEIVQATLRYLRRRRQGD